MGLLIALAAVAFCVKTLVDEWSTIGPSIARGSIRTDSGIPCSVQTGSAGAIGSTGSGRYAW